MANTLTAIIPKVLARGLQVLRGALVMPRVVNTDYGSDAAKKGETIDVPIPVSQTASAVTPSNTKPSLTDKTPTTVAVALDQWKMTDFHLSDNDMQKIDQNEHFIPLQTQSAIDALAEDINGYITGLYTAVYAHVGTAGTTPFATAATALINARKKLHELKAPKPARRFVMDLDAEANALALSTFADAEKTADGGAVKIEGEVGRKYGFDNFSDQQIKTHTLVGAGTPLVDGAAQTGKTLVSDGWTTKPEAGDLFTIAGDTTQYVVVSSTTLATTESTLTIEPAITSAPADNAAMTMVATHVANLAFHRDAFAFAMRPLVQTTQAMAFGSQILSLTDPATGVSLRLEVTRVHKAVTWEFDVLYGAKMLRGELVCRVLG